MQDQEGVFDAFEQHGAVGVEADERNVENEHTCDGVNVFDDPQVKHRELRVEIPNALGGVTPVVRSPLRLSETPVEYKIAPPLLGQHTEEVLKNLLGKGAEDIRRLRAKNIV